VGKSHHQAQEGRKVITKHSLVLNLIREMEKECIRTNQNKSFQRYWTKSEAHTLQ